jgi:SulP family sulfate permease
MNAKSKLETGQASFVELFTPKLVTVFREGYGATELRADAVAGSNADKF